MKGCPHHAEFWSRIATPKLIALFLAAGLLSSVTVSSVTARPGWALATKLAKKPAKKAIAVRQAKGAVNAGRLEHASRLRNSRAIRLRFPRNAWGTRRLVTLIEQCARTVKTKHGRSHRLLVGDLSRKKGGPMPPHAGHQNGREADIGFYLRSGRAMPGLWRVGPSHIDAKRTLTFLSCLIASRQVMRLFLDRKLQAPLAREAKRRGWSKGRVLRTFSWPRGRRSRVGLVQHRRGHFNHLHLRLRCDGHETGCRNGPVARRNAFRLRRKRRRRVRRRKSPHHSARGRHGRRSRQRARHVGKSRRARRNGTAG